MILVEEFSPAARDMDLIDVIREWSEVNAIEEARAYFRSSGPVIGRLEFIGEKHIGDRVVLIVDHKQIAVILAADHGIGPSPSVANEQLERLEAV